MQGFFFTLVFSISPFCGVGIYMDFHLFFSLMYRICHKVVCVNMCVRTRIRFPLNFWFGFCFACGNALLVIRVLIQLFNSTSLTIAFVYHRTYPPLCLSHAHTLLLLFFQQSLFFIFIYAKIPT